MKSPHLIARIPYNHVRTLSISKVKMSTPTLLVVSCWLHSGGGAHEQELLWSWTSRLCVTIDAAHPGRFNIKLQHGVCVCVWGGQGRT